MLGKVLQIPEFNEEDDLRSGIGLDVHYDKLAYFVNSGFPWRGVTQLREVFQNLLNEVQVAALYFALPKNAVAYEEHAAPSPFGWTSSVAVAQGVKTAL